MKAVIHRSKLASLFAPALAVALLTGCGGGGEAGSTPAAGLPIAVGQINGSGDGNSSAPSNGAVVGESCVSSDPNHICLGIQFVTYKNSGGTPVANQSQAATIIHTMNQLWSQCNLGFQIESYEQVDPTQSGLSYGANSQNELNQIRSTYGTLSNELLAVSTGPWGTSVNAWTNMPGSGPYGAIMEASIVGYGDGIIYAHEFGHYLGLDHVSDSSELMNAIIATNSTAISSGECQTARDTATQFWSAMVRR